MSDQYLWDGSGEPDPEIEMIERRLAAFRYKPRELELPEIEPKLAAPVRPLWQLAVAASIAVLFLLGLVWLVSRGWRGGDRQTPTQAAIGDKHGLTSEPGPKKENSLPNKALPTATPQSSVARVEKPLRSEGFKTRTAVKDGHASADRIHVQDTLARTSFVDHLRQPSPFDVETSLHIEKSQMLLRSFKNSDDTGEALAATVAFDRSQAQQILYDNILLRRSAEKRGNLPLQEVLGNLEPFLLDISNLPEKASVEDVRAIKERIRSDEIVTTLQAYAPPVRAW